MSESTKPIFERTFANNLDDLERTMDEAEAFAAEHQFSPSVCYGLRLSIEEISTNILKYAYNDTAPHHILLRLEILPDSLLLLLEDDGLEFNPLNAPEADIDLPLEERSIGGLGIHLIRRFAQRLAYQRENGRNQFRIWLKK